RRRRCTVWLAATQSEVSGSRGTGSRNDVEARSNDGPDLSADLGEEVRKGPRQDCLRGHFPFPPGRLGLLTWPRASDPEAGSRFEARNAGRAARMFEQWGTSDPRSGVV